MRNGVPKREIEDAVNEGGKGVEQLHSQVEWGRDIVKFTFCGSPNTHIIQILFSLNMQK